MVKCCLPQILLGPFLNTLSHLYLKKNLGPIFKTQLILKNNDREEYAAPCHKSKTELSAKAKYEMFYRVVYTRLYYKDPIESFIIFVPSKHFQSIAK